MSQTKKSSHTISQPKLNSTHKSIHISKKDRVKPVLFPPVHPAIARIIKEEEDFQSQFVQQTKNPQEKPVSKFFDVNIDGPMIIAFDSAQVPMDEESEKQ